MPEPRTLRRIVKAKDGRQVFRIATVKRDPFKQEYIDLCSSTFDEALFPGTSAQQSAASSFEQVSARGRHALERSEIIKAQSVTLGKLVSGALRANKQSSKTGANDDASDKEGDNNSKPTRKKTLDEDDVLRRFANTLAGNPEPLPLSQIFGDTPFAAFANSASQDDSHSSDDAQSSPIDVEAMIRLQTVPSSELLMRDPDALKALLDFAEDSPRPTDNSDAIIGELPSNRELLAMIEPAEEEFLSSEDEGDDGSMVPDFFETAQPSEDCLLEELSSPAPDSSASPAFAAGLNTALQPMQLAPELDSHVAMESRVVPSSSANLQDTDNPAHANGADVGGAPAVLLPMNAVLLSESLTAAVSMTGIKPRRAKKSTPAQSKYGRLLVDLSRPAPDIGPPPKAARKIYSPRNPSDLSAALTTPWSKRPQTQTLCACTGVLIAASSAY